MKVREHCFAGVWKNSPLKVVNMMLPAPPSPPIGRHIVTVFLQRKRANMVTMYDCFISPNCWPEYLPPLNCHTTDPCPPTTVTPTALSSSSGRPRKQSKCSVQECDGTGQRNPARWSEGHTTRAGCSLACQTFHSAKGEEKSGNLPIPFWFAEFGIILRHVNGMLILCCHVQWTCTCRVW